MRQTGGLAPPRSARIRSEFVRLVIRRAKRIRRLDPSLLRHIGFVGEQLCHDFQSRHDVRRNRTRVLGHADQHTINPTIDFQARFGRSEMNIAGTGGLSEPQQVLDDPHNVFRIFGIEFWQGHLILISESHRRRRTCGGRRDEIAFGNVTAKLARTLANS